MLSGSKLSKQQAEETYIVGVGVSSYLRDQGKYECIFLPFCNTQQYNMAYICMYIVLYNMRIL